jgi:Kef-type K+ transport system membrane component KefB
MTLHEFLVSLIILYVSARVFGELAVRLGQSAVLGDLVAGVLIGSSGLGWVEPTETLKLMGEIGVMLLLFEIGLESDPQTFFRVWKASAGVAVIGVLAPFVLGYGLAVAAGLGPLQAAFIGATLMATSVAISVRVLADFDRLRSAEGSIILGAAVIDDILVLLVLSVIISLADRGAVSGLDILKAAGPALLFLCVAIAVGIRFVHLFSSLVNRMSTRGSLVITAMTFALILGESADLVGLAPIIGAFAAGLVLARAEHHAHITERIKPVSDVFVPIFFVLAGAAVELSLLNPFERRNWPLLLLTAGLIVVAVIGKLVAGLGAVGERVNRLAIGAGMVPRGEVALIIAATGLSHGVIAQREYGAIILMVAALSLLAPVLLKLALQRTPH